MSKDDHLTRPPLRVVIAHPTAFGRMALRMLLDHERDIDVVGDADEAAAGGRLAHELAAACLVVHEALLGRHRTGPLSLATALIVLGMETHPAAAQAAVRDGASAYVRWDRAAEDLPAALRGLGGQAVFTAGD